VPRQETTGGRPKLLGITKRGSKYLRKMLIQGARAALPTLKTGETRIGAWLRGLLARAHANTAVVAWRPRWRASCGRCYGTNKPMRPPPSRQPDPQSAGAVGRRPSMSVSGERRFKHRIFRLGTSSPRWRVW